MEQKKLFEIIADQLEIPVRDIKLKSFIVDDLGADSLDQVELIMAIEEESDISIPDEKAELIKTVGDIWDYISKTLIQYYSLLKPLPS